jgi:hypothetical protein
MALGEELPDELVQPQFSQPLAIRFLTASPGPLPTGKVTRIGSRSSRCSLPGASSRRTTYLQVGETIRPVRVDGDRRGYVIATADTNIEALERAEAAARLLVTWRSSMSCDFDSAHYRELLEAAQRAATASRASTGRPSRPVILRHDVDLSLEGALAMAEVEADEPAHGRRGS